MSNRGSIQLNVMNFRMSSILLGFSSPSCWALIWRFCPVSRSQLVWLIGNHGMCVLDNDVPELSGEPTLAATADLFLFFRTKTKNFSSAWNSTVSKTFFEGTFQKLWMIWHHVGVMTLAPIFLITSNIIPSAHTHEIYNLKFLEVIKTVYFQKFSPKNQHQLQQQQKQQQKLQQKLQQW